MASERVSVRKATFSNDYVATDNQGNEGRGSTEQRAIEALKMAQNKPKK